MGKKAEQEQNLEQEQNPERVDTGLPVMRIATAHLKSAYGSPYKASKWIGKTHEDDETPVQFEERCWMERAHWSPRGTMLIPGPAFKLALQSAGAWLAMKIKGEGSKTYTARFRQAVMVLDDLDTGVSRDDVEKETLFIPGNPGGRSKDSSRVIKHFPTLKEWGGEIKFHVLDNVISEDVFEKHLVTAGRFVGVGMWRAERGGTAGRFDVKSIKWEVIE